MNTRYLQRDRRRKLKRKVFVSGMPFKAKAAEFLVEFFSSHNVAPPARVAALEKGGRKTGQAYATFETTEAADAAVALSGSKREGGRWLEIKRVAEKPPAKDAATGGDDSSSSDGDSSSSDDDAAAPAAAAASSSDDSSSSSSDG